MGKRSDVLGFFGKDGGSDEKSNGEAMGKSDGEVVSGEGQQVKKKDDQIKE